MSLSLQAHLIPRNQVVAQLVSTALAGGDPAVGSKNEQAGISHTIGIVLAEQEHGAGGRGEAGGNLTRLATCVTGHLRLPSKAATQARLEMWFQAPHGRRCGPA